MVWNFNEYFELMTKHPKKYSAINERNSMQFFLEQGKVPQYLPPTNKDSNIYLELQAAVIRKKYEHERGINYKYKYFKINTV